MEKTRFITENGIILDHQNRVILKVDGQPSHVNFPEEAISKIHKIDPNYINRLVHTHPMGMFSISSVDRKMMKKWAVAMHPFPFRLSTLTTDNDFDLIESIYVARLDPRS